MVVEAAVLDGQHGVAHVLGDLGQRHLAPLLAAGGDERGQERRFERDPADRRAVGGALDAPDRRRRRGPRLGAGRAEDDADQRAFLLAAADGQLDGVVAEGELAGFGGLRAAGIAGIVEPLDQAVRGQRLAGRSSSGRA